MVNTENMEYSRFCAEPPQYKNPHFNDLDLDKFLDKETPVEDSDF